MGDGVTYGSVFLSHRRSDAGYSERLREELLERIPGAQLCSSADPAFAGHDWRERLEAALARSSFVIYIVGRDWLSSISSARPVGRPDDERARVELETALRLGVPMIAAQLGGAEIPERTELPRVLQPLHAWDGVQISDESWQHDIDQLIHAIDRTRTTSPLQVGAVFAGHRIEALLGRGRLGVVYRARHVGWDRADAIKVVSGEWARMIEIRKRFSRESKLTTLLRHDNIINVYDAGEENGLLYMTMQLVEGRDLATLLAVEAPTSGTMATAILAPIADALALAHGKGFAHRDVKPANILLDEKDGLPHPYLSDFGIAYQVNRASTVLTLPGQAQGTMDYMSPEQIRSDEIDGSTDVYALGCILFEMLSGHAPYASYKGMRVLWAHLQESPQALQELRPDLPMGFDELVHHAMAKTPADRPSAAEFRTALEALSSDIGLQPDPGPTISTVGDRTIHDVVRTTPVATETQQPAPERSPPEGIFICYRREDARWPARTLAQALRDRFGGQNVFMDVDTVRVGNWRNQINHALDASAVVLVLIGPNWMDQLSKRSAGDDEVRYEIATAIKRRMQLIPVMCDNAPIPKKAALPADIATLVDQQAYQLGEDRYWEPMAKILIDDLAVALMPQRP